jgi:hypothetical protein
MLEQKLIDAVARQTTVIDSTITFLAGLTETLRNMGGSSAEENALADELDAKSTELANAIATPGPGPA